jgi:hypothetical protein
LIAHVKIGLAEFVQSHGLNDRLIRYPGAIRSGEVFPSERLLPAAADARLINSGQSCIAAKRFIVVEKIEEMFLEQFPGQSSIPGHHQSEIQLRNHCANRSPRFPAPSTRIPQLN